jgi:NAD(P)-dependent dehydrogenase (short-subunit alcohol dehydrogenase family)
MKRQRYGRILFTSSSSGMFGHPWQAAYGAAKAGIAGLSGILAIEGKDHGVVVNAILPSALGEVRDPAGFSEPLSVYDEALAVRERSVPG